MIEALKDVHASDSDSQTLCLHENGRTLEYQLGMVLWGFYQCRAAGLTLGEDCDFATIVDNAIGNTEDPDDILTSDYNSKISNYLPGGYSNLHLEETDLNDKLDNYFTAVETAHIGDEEFNEYKKFFSSRSVLRNFSRQVNTADELDGGRWMTWPIPCHWLWMLLGNCNIKPTELDIVLQLFGYAPPPADVSQAGKLAELT